MQVLWREALEGNRPITMDEFLYCYKPSEIKKSAGFYQFSSRGSYYSLIKGRSSSDQLWKKEFFIISGNWAGDPADVGNPPFPSFTSPLGRLRPEVMFFFPFYLVCPYIFPIFQSFNPFSWWCSCCSSTLGQILLGLDRSGSYLPREDFPRLGYSQSSSSLGTWSSAYYWEPKSRGAHSPK